MSVYGLLGRKLGHSYSPDIHRAMGGYEYRLFEVEPAGLSDFLAWQGFSGLNVTIPYKKDVIPFCSELSPTARAIGSVNTILRNPDGSLYGENTDAAGFAHMVGKSGIEVGGKKVLVLGSGGSSLSVCYVLRELGPGSLTVISRQGDNNYDNLHLHADAQIIVNTTPVGMYPDTDLSPVSLDHFPRLEGVLDIIYNPATTRLLMDAWERGLPHLGGLHMLIGQARAACELFLGHPVDADKEHTIHQMLRRKMGNIVLIGMPGCGKSTIGRILANRLGKTFVDADAILEQTAGMSIPEIFAQEGEAAFRKRETQTLRQLGKLSGQVIATGGGCVTREENHFYLRQNAIIVFIERAVHQLARGGRPLSAGNLEEMYRHRRPLYRRFADFTVQNNSGVKACADQILASAY